MDLRHHASIKLAELEKESENTRLALSFCPEGRIVRSGRGDTAYYLWRFENPDGHLEKRRLTKQPKLMQRLMRKKYLETKAAFTEKKIAALKALLENYPEQAVDDILKALPETYRSLPESLFLIPAEAEIASGIANPAGIASYARFCESIGEDAGALPEHKSINWADAAYEISRYRSEERRHTTTRGLKVRSKAELLIAEALYKFEIPFHYEEVLHIGDRSVVPDFTIMKSDGSFSYWEHCGLMKDAKYRARLKEKLELYESVGVAHWKNLILTYDDDEGGINLSIVESEIKNKLLQPGK